VTFKKNDFFQIIHFMHQFKKFTLIF